tara:strand:- start:3052 stop:3705 length:654 start_codon:yes stop_codon:yes gene_type:complete
MVFYNKKYNEIKLFCKKYNNSAIKKNISIISVSKTRGLDDIKQALDFGLRNFGEIRVSEANEKFAMLKETYNDIKLHMIGPIQTNKVKKALKIFDFFHSLDRSSLADEFSKNSQEALNKYFFIQVNTGHEQQKSGIDPRHSSEFINYCKQDLKLNVIGLMCLPPINEDPKPHFLMLKQIAIKNSLMNLSMGMSGDYKIALSCGATHIRIGTSFFGAR